jgi:bifunctional ADP-heptose synthase (sugar kinase/adenylyltransferase)
MKKTIKISRRLAILFGYTTLASLPLASSLGIEEGKAALLAGLAAGSLVLQRLGRSYVEDGELTNKEIDNAFMSEDGSDNSV